MKKQIADFLKYLGYQTAYSGKEKIMFIRDKDNRPVNFGVVMGLYKKIGLKLPFTLKGG